MSPEVGNLLLHEVAPRLASAIPYNVNSVGCEDAQELIQDGTALAARMVHNAELAGKRLVQSARSHARKGVKVITAGNIAYYCIVKLRNGCRSNGMVTGDVYGCGIQIQGRTRLNSLDEVVAQDEGGEILLHDVLAADQEDPGTKACRKLDWQTVMAGLSERERVAIEFLVEGRTLRKAAHVLRTSNSSMQASKRDLRAKILSFVGSDILAQVQRQPQWKDGLDATRERMAGREGTGSVAPFYSSCAGAPDWVSRGDFRSRSPRGISTIIWSLVE